MSLQKARQAARKALERTYEGRATVTEYREIRDQWGLTSFQDVVVLEDQPCKLSFETLANTESGGHVATIAQGVKLFLSPDVPINPGSKIVVTQHGVTTEYASSGVPAVYATHQEIMLTLYDRYA